MGMTNTDFIAAIRTLSSALLRPAPGQRLENLIDAAVNLEVAANARALNDDLDSIARDLIAMTRDAFPQHFPA